MNDGKRCMDLGSHGVLISKPELLVSDCGGNNNSFSWWQSTLPARRSLGLYQVMAKDTVSGFGDGGMAITDDFGALVKVAA